MRQRRLAGEKRSPSAQRGAARQPGGNAKARPGGGAVPLARSSAGGSALQQRAAFTHGRQHGENSGNLNDNGKAGDIPWRDKYMMAGRKTMGNRALNGAANKL